MKWRQLATGLRDGIAIQVGANALYFVLLAVVPYLAIGALTLTDRDQLLTPQNRLSLLVLGLSGYTFFLRFVAGYFLKKEWVAPYQNFAWLVGYTVFVGYLLLQYNVSVPKIPVTDFETIQQFAYVFLVLVPSSTMGSLFTSATEHNHDEDMQKSLRDIQTSITKLEDKINQVLPNESAKLSANHPLAEPSTKKARTDPPKPQNKRNKSVKRRH